MLRIIYYFILLVLCSLSMSTMYGQPSEGEFYQVQKGDNLLNIVGEAYNVPSGALRLELAKRVNEYPVNHHLHVTSKGDFKKKHFPQGIITMNPKFNCAIFQEDAASGEKRCYARVYFPYFIDLPDFGIDKGPARISPCKGGGGTKLKVTVPKSKHRDRKNRIKVLAKGKGKISPLRALPLIDAINSSRTEKVQYDPWKLLYYINQMEIRINLVEDTKYKKGTEVEDALRKYSKTSIPNGKDAIFIAKPAIFGYMFESEGALNTCLSKLYKKAGLTPLKDLPRNRYYIVVHMFFPKSLSNKISSKKPKYDPESDGYQAVHQFVLPNWTPIEANEWVVQPADIVPITIRFPMVDDKWNRDVVIWKYKGKIAAYTEKAASFEYCLKQVKRQKIKNSFHFTHPFMTDERVAKIVQATYQQWNTDMSYFVEDQLKDPSLAEILVHRNSDEFLVAVINGTRKMMSAASSANLYPKSINNYAPGKVKKGEVKLSGGKWEMLSKDPDLAVQIKLLGGSTKSFIAWWAYRESMRKGDK